MIVQFKKGGENVYPITNVRNHKIISFDYICVPIYGQSLAIGGDTTRLTTAAEFPDITLNTENLTNSFSENKETSNNGLLDSFVENYASIGKTAREFIASKIVSFYSGQGSSPITALKKGTTPYANFISQITTAYNTAVSQSKSFVIPAFCWIQGEGDRMGEYTTNYKSELLQLRADLDADIKAITGQEVDVNCIVYQTNQLSVLTTGTEGQFNPLSFDPYVARTAVMTAQYELIRDNQYFHASSPIYTMDFYVSSNGARIHITNVSQRFLGYYEGITLARLLLGWGTTDGLIVSSVTKQDTTHLIVNLSVPCSPVVFDTEAVKEVAHYGFTCVTSGGSDIISDVEIIENRFGVCKIKITTSANCTGAKLRYACNGDAGYSGWERGARGNVRDSQGQLFKAKVGDTFFPLDNWLYGFEYLIS